MRRGRGLLRRRVRVALPVRGSRVVGANRHALARNRVDELILTAVVVREGVQSLGAGGWLESETTTL